MSNSLSENVYRISPNAERWIKISAITVMLIVASSSAILSFEGLRTVALEAKIPETLSFLFPIAVDATILMGSLSVLRFELAGAKSYFGWLTVFLGTMLSIGGNVLSVLDDGWIAQLVHGLIPVLLCISLESLLKILRFNIKKSHMVEISNKMYQKETHPETNNNINNSTVASDITSNALDLKDERVSHIVDSNSLQRETGEINNSPYDTQDIIMSISTSNVSDDSPEVSEELIVNPEIDREDIDRVASDEAIVKESIENSTPLTNIQKYEQILQQLSPDTKRNKKIYLILKQFPDAKMNDMKKAIGDPLTANYSEIVKKIKQMQKESLKKESA